MTELLLDVRAGATAAALLGALVELGASLEAVERAVKALGDGDVRLSVQGGREGTLIRVRAPHGAPLADDWAQLRPRVSLLALDDDVVAQTLAILDALFGARAAIHGVEPLNVDVDPFSGVDDLAAAVALAAATVDLGPLTAIRTTPTGHGTGDLETIEGPIELPGPVVAALLADRATLALDLTSEVVDPLGAAYLHALTTDTGPDEMTGARQGPGRGRLGPGASVGVLRAWLNPAPSHGLDPAPSHGLET